MLASAPWFYRLKRYSRINSFAAIKRVERGRLALEQWFITDSQQNYNVALHHDVWGRI
jgi:hypothetical protein